MDMLPSSLGTVIPAGSTAGEIQLARTEAGVFILTMLAEPAGNRENRWTLGFARAMHVAFDAIEAELEASTGPAALLTASDSEKFFSNGIDPQWLMDTSKAGDPDQELKMWDDLVMPAFARPLRLPIPTVAAIGGHCFGAGLMFALGCDTRLMREDRGFLCAPEVGAVHAAFPASSCIALSPAPQRACVACGDWQVAIGIDIPSPELTLFKHAMPIHAFHQTVLEAKRWSGPEALAAGIVSAVHPMPQLLQAAVSTAEQLAQLGKKRWLMYVHPTAAGHIPSMISVPLSSSSSSNAAGIGAIWQQLTTGLSRCVRAHAGVTSRPRPRATSRRRSCSTASRPIGRQDRCPSPLVRPVCAPPAGPACLPASAPLRALRAHDAHACNVR
jgi:enoyl-CoA hydratase/carnithine racemase